MELFWIGIAVSQRGRGLGGQLLERAIAAARERWDDVCSVRLHVMANNAAVRNDAGFEAFCIDHDDLQDVAPAARRLARAEEWKGDSRSFSNRSPNMFHSSSN